MEHIPKVENPSHRDLEIPILVKSGQEYRGTNVDDFLSFLPSKGLVLGKLELGDFGDSNTYDDAISYVQAWGYFGMLTEFLRVADINMRFEFDETLKDGGVSFLNRTSAQLPDLMRLWHDRAIRKDKENMMEGAEKVTKILDAVKEVILAITRQEYRGGSFSSDEKILPEDNVDNLISDALEGTHTQDHDHEGNDHSHGHPHGFGLIITDQYYDRNRNFFSDEKGWEDEKIKVGHLTYNLGRVGSKAHQILFSIIILGEALENAASSAYKGIRKFQRFGVNTMLMSILLGAAGWCPYQVQILLSYFSATHMYYLTFFDRSQYAENHRACCTTYCVAWQVDEATYKTRHAVDDCECEFIDFQEHEEVSEWIEHGKTCLVKRDIGNTKGWTLVPSHVDGKATRYIGISHVWGDGMGNTSGNSLPKCQLERLQKAVNDVARSEDDVPFWIDTICVPRNSPSLRKLSIKAMGSIYEEAYGVLVMDNTLTNVNADASIEEIFMNIATSGWMTRLWTLSEGMSARSLHFQLRQRAVAIEDLQFDYRLNLLKKDMQRYEELSESKFNPPLLQVLGRQLYSLREWDETKLPPVELANLKLSSPIYYDVTEYLGFIRMLRRMAKDDGELLQNKEFLFLWAITAVKSRSTSKIEDELLCVLRFIGLDLKPFLEVEHESRMLSFLLHYSNMIPTGIIFGTNPRIDAPGCGWAPLSLTHPELNWKGKEGKATHYGIYAYYRAPSLRAVEKSGFGIHFGLIDSSSGTRYLVDVHGIEEDQVVPFKPTMRIIVECPLGTQDTTKGVLVNIYANGFEKAFADIVRPVSIRDLGERKPLSDHECVTADTVVPDRLWCIG